MDDKLKKFVSEHRQEFDTDEPVKGLWENIDAQMDLKNSSRMSSKWLSKFMYLAFSASVLVIAVYFSVKRFHPSSAKGLVVDKTDSLLRHSEDFQQADRYKTEVVGGENNNPLKENAPAANGNRSEPNAGSLQATDHQILSATNQLEEGKKDSVSNAATNLSKPFEANSPDHKKTNPEMSGYAGSKETAALSTHSVNDKNKNNRTKNTKKAELYIPEQPEDFNSYTATLYESASFCPVVHAYKFPGKVSMKDGIFHKDPEKYKRMLSTVSCSQLEGEKNIKAVWLKGKTDKELTVSIKKRFKNIVLVKRNGRKLNPEAISHYYAGRGVISGYKGMYFNLVFKTNVEIILFFKDMEAGDKIILDGSIEAVVKEQPYRP